MFKWSFGSQPNIEGSGLTTFGHDDFADRYPKPGHVLVPCPSANCFQSRVCLNGTFVPKDCGYFSMIAAGIWGIYRVSIGYLCHMWRNLWARRESRWFTAVFSRSREPSVRSGDRCVHFPPLGGRPVAAALLVGSRVPLEADLPREYGHDMGRA